jgi:hypothetical protein
MAYPVKWFHSDMAGAPKLLMSSTNLQPGAIINVLDACLLNGFNTKILDSLTYNPGTNEVTGTVTGGHGFLKYQVILIGGANEAAFNGEQRVTFVDTTTFKFTPATAPPSTATGNITAKAAPLGTWEKSFADTNKAVYRSTDILSTGFCMRLDDTTTTWGKKVEGYESMSDVDTGINNFGSSSGYFSGGGSGPAKWVLVGDTRIFYINFYNYSGTSIYAGTACFGDFNSFKSGDAYNTVLLSNSNTPGGGPFTWGLLYLINSSRSSALARGYNPASLAVTMSARGTPIVGVYPNPVDGLFYINESPLLITENDDNLRGTLVFLITQDRSGAGIGSIKGQAAFNLTGSWR